MLSKPLLKTHEVAELLKVQEATVRTWIRAGELPAVQLHREWRVAVKHLEEFVASRLSIKSGTASKIPNGHAFEADAIIQRAHSTRNGRRPRRSA